MPSGRLASRNLTHDHKKSCVQQLRERSPICWSPQTSRIFQNLPIQHLPAKKRTHPRSLHIHTHMLAALHQKVKQGWKISLLSGSGCNSTSLMYWVHQNAMTYTFVVRVCVCVCVRGRIKEFFLHITEKHFKFLYTAARWCFQKFFHGFFCIANVTSPENTFPGTSQQCWEGRGKGAGIAKRQLCDQPKQLAPEATREKKIGEQKVRVLKYWNKKEEHTEKSYARRRL